MAREDLKKFYNKDDGTPSSIYNYVRGKNIGTIYGTQLGSNANIKYHDAAWRAEQRGTKARMLSGTTEHDTHVTETSPNWSDVKIIDLDWISSRFIVPDSEIPQPYRSNRYFTSTGWKMSSTRLGYNMAINARPQFCRFTDIKGNTRGRTTGTYPMFDEVKIGPTPGGRGRYGLGMGRYYSEAIDDNATTIFMQFGVPRFNSLIGFLLNSITSSQAYVANTGRVPAFYYVGRAIGSIAIFCLFPVITIGIWALKFLYQFVASESYKFYYLSPAMHLYWGTVNTIVSMLATDLGFLAPQYLKDKDKATKLGTPVIIDKEDLAIMKEYMPDLISANTGYLDIFAVATKHQRLVNMQSQLEYKLYEKFGDDPHNININPNALYGYIKESEETIMPARIPQSGSMGWLNDAFSFSKFINRHIQNDPDTNKPGMYKMTETKEMTLKADDAENRDTKKGIEGKNGIEQGVDVPNPDGSYNIRESDTKMLEGIADSLSAVLRDGGLYAVFNVNYQGSASESISSSTGDVELQGMINSLVKNMKNLHVNLAGGNVVPMMGDVIDQVRGFISGSLEGVTHGLSNIVTVLTGGALVEIPKKWEDTSISLNSVRYEMDLISPYGNPLSQLQNIYIPLAMLLAGALPLSTGHNSYTSPFLCSIFNKGVQDVALGMITSLNIERGVTNLPFNRNKRALSFKVSFTVTDFNPVLSAPVNASIFDGMFSVGHNDNSNFGRYLATMASRDLYTKKYFGAKIAIRKSRVYQAFSQATSHYGKGFMFGEWIQPIFTIFTEEKKLNQTQNNNISYF